MLDNDISTAGALRHLTTPEAAFTRDEAHALDRRRFLQLVGMGLGAGAVAGPGSSLLDTALGGGNTSWAAGPVAADDGILLVIGLFGGNDGLNTVVPISDGKYYDQRGTLAVAPGDTLAIDSATGLHPNLGRLKQFWDQGNLAIVEGIGRPNTDFSHFNSMARWMSGYASGVPRSGWVGRWLDGYLNGSKDLFAAAEVGYSLPLHMVGASSRATTIPAGRPDFGAGTSDNDLRMYQTIRAMNSGSTSFWQSQVAGAFVDQLDVAKTIAPHIPGELPETDIVARLEVAARLINANLGFRVVSAGFGDFDSHSGQADQHPTRMQELNDAVTRFFDVLNPAWLDRVTVMTFSEFGRTRISDGDGTDHGSSAPHFVFGANVKGGRYGQRPTLGGLDRWERMAHHVDFRDYFGSVVDGWLGGGAADVFGKSIDNLGLFSGSPGIPSTSGPGLPPQLLGDFVAIAPTRVVDTRSGNGAAKRPIGPDETITVATARVGGLPAAGVTAVVVNITSVNTTADTYLTVYATGAARPDTANLLPVPGRVVGNLSVSGVSQAGQFAIFNKFGTTDCVVDIAGYFTSAAASKLTPLVPNRLLDTRFGIGTKAGRVHGDTSVELTVTGRGGVPADATAVVMNVTTVAPSAYGFVTAHAVGDTRAEVSSVNYEPGMHIPNLVMCKVGPGGKILLYASHGELDIVADVVACYSPVGDQHKPVTPVRLLDTRKGIGSPAARVSGGQHVTLQVAGRGGVPANATAVVFQVTAVAPTAASFISVFPTGVERPETANLNFVAGQTVLNLVVAKLGANGNVDLFNAAGAVDIVVDLNGYFV
jgi:uncharacterized protein (DUF1501 family)